MPTSEKQIDANRQNAQKSTGPKTEEGKKRTSLNGARHNLTGAAYVMSDEDRRAFDKFSGPFIASLNPAGAAEHSYAHLVAVAHWRLNRVHAIEENTFSLGHYTKAGDVDFDHPELHHALTQARVFDLKGDVFKNLSLYEQRIAREMNRNLKTLFLLQDRGKTGQREKALEPARETSKPKARAAGSSLPPTDLPPTDLPPADLAPAHTPPTESPARTCSAGLNGFAFSTGQTPPPEHAGNAAPAPTQAHSSSDLRVQTPPLDERAERVAA